MEIKSSSSPVLLSPEAGYDLWARSWDRDPSPIVALEKRTIAPWLADLRGKKFIEASCGTGRWLLYAAEGGGQVTGFDLSPAMLAEAAAKPGLPGRVALADTRALPLANGCADTVLCALSLGHIPPAEATVAELARVVTPGGTLIVTDFHPEASRAGWKRTFRKGKEVYEVENHPYSIAAICRVTAHAGFALRELSEPCFGEPERDVFLRAGRGDLFETACGRPAIFAAVFQRSLGGTRQTGCSATHVSLSDRPKPCPWISKSPTEESGLSCLRAMSPDRLTPKLLISKAA